MLYAEVLEVGSSSCRVVLDTRLLRCCERRRRHDGMRAGAYLLDDARIRERAESAFIEMPPHGEVHVIRTVCWGVAAHRPVYPLRAHAAYRHHIIPLSHSLAP
jgi:hypothetical protein